jgi:hypothetical protein
LRWRPDALIGLGKAAALLDLALNASAAFAGGGVVETAGR